MPTKPGRFTDVRYLWVLSAIPLTACGGLVGDPSKDEVAWAKSPDGRVHAILSETDGGASTSFGYRVELHSADHGAQGSVFAGSLYGAVRSDCAYGVDLHWADPTTLEVRFLSAKDVDLQQSVTVGGRAIRLVARPGVRNEAAPCGGMLADRSSK